VGTNICLRSAGEPTGSETETATDGARVDGIGPGAPTAAIRFRRNGAAAGDNSDFIAGELLADTSMPHLQRSMEVGE